jgi:hypothetical protein
MVTLVPEFDRGLEAPLSIAGPGVDLQAKAGGASGPRSPAAHAPELRYGLVLNPRRGLVRHPAEAQRCPGAGVELVGAVETVAGADRVVATGFAHAQPVEVAGRGARGGRRCASCGEGGEDSGGRGGGKSAADAGFARTQTCLRQRGAFPHACEVSCRVRAGCSPAGRRLCGPASPLDREAFWSAQWSLRSEDHWVPRTCPVRVSWDLSPGAGFGGRGPVARARELPPHFSLGQESQTRCDWDHACRCASFRPFHAQRSHISPGERNCGVISLRHAGGADREISIPKRNSAGPKEGRRSSVTTRGDAYFLVVCAFGLALAVTAFQVSAPTTPSTSVRWWIFWNASVARAVIGP